MPVRLATHAMGTRFEVLLDGGPEPFLRAVGEEALREVESWHTRLSAFQPESVVSLINREAADRPVRLDADTFELLRLCARAHAASAGAFDPTVGALMRAWGFHPGQATGVRAGEAPVGMEHVALDERRHTVRFARPGLRLDLGAIAKGFALDRAAAIVREHGVRCALLHGGTSSIVAIGTPPGRSGWRITIRSAGEPAAVSLADTALGVSAPRGRLVDHGAAALGHIMDPRTAAPARGVDTGAVVGPSAALADAWSTALVVTGGRGLARPDAYTFLIHEPAPGWRADGPLAGAIDTHKSVEAA